MDVPPLLVENTILTENYQKYFSKKLILCMSPKAATVDYGLSFANQRKQTFILRFCLQGIKRNLPFPFSISSKTIGFCHFPFTKYAS
jgi:hypothetical protein